MLPKKNRVDKNLAQKIFKNGRFLVSGNLVFRFIKNYSNIRRVSFVAPKSLSKKAVVRNMLRRKGYLAIEKYISDLPQGIAGMFVFNKNFNKTEDIENEIKKIVDRIN